MATPIHCGDNRAPQPIPRGDWKAFAIHPESLIDVCRIDGQLLAPGDVVFVTSPSPRLDMVRGACTGGLLTGAVPNIQAAEVNAPLILTAWETCDDVATPGPRAPWTDSLRLKVATGGAGDLPYNVWKRVMRAPFQGRRHGAFHFYGTITSGAMTADARVRGVRYRGRRFSVTADATLLSEEPIQDESANTAYVNTTAVNGDPLGVTLHVGGTDSEEDYDELQLWLRNTSPGPDNWVGFMHVEAEMFGERNR